VANIDKIIHKMNVHSFCKHKIMLKLKKSTFAEVKIKALVRVFFCVVK